MSDMRDEMRELLASWRAVPAFLCDRHFTVVASNTAASAVSPAFVEGTNLARFAYLEPDVNRDHAMWPEASSQVAVLLRESLDEHEADPSFHTIVGELSAHSRDFSVAWADDARTARTWDWKMSESCSAKEVPFQSTKTTRRSATASMRSAT